MWLYFLIFRAQLVYGYVSDWAQNQSEHIRAWYIAWNIIFMCMASQNSQTWRRGHWGHKCNKTAKSILDDSCIVYTISQIILFLFRSSAANSTTALYNLHAWWMLQFTHNFLWCLIFSAHAQILGVYIKGFKWIVCSLITTIFLSDCSTKIAILNVLNRYAWPDCVLYLFMFTLGPVFDQDLEAGVNEQINAELSAHYTYLSMVRRNNKRNYSYLI